MNSRVLYIVVLILIVSALILTAQEQTDSDIDSISREKNVLDSLLDIHESEVEQLYLIDEQLTLTQTLIHKLERKKRNASSRLNQLSENIDSNTVRLDKLKQKLAASLEKFYINYQPASTALFSAGNLQQAARQLHYFKITLNSLRTLIDSVTVLKINLETDQTELIAVRRDADNLVQRKSLEESLLEKRKKDKSRLLIEIESDVRLKQQYVDNINQNQQALSDLTGDLQTDRQSTQFESLKGNLPWPLTGRIIRRFGLHLDQQTNTETFYPGIQIRVEPDTPVKACAGGKVAHADYLRGYGNMIILDHGQGWYTLYGHLSQINVRIGQEVRRDELLGYSGETGSNDGPVLFFGIRNRSESFDPVEWLK